MDALTTLFIRACKSNHTERRLVKVYKRFFLASPHEPLMWAVIANRLMDIAIKYSPNLIQDLVLEMSPEKDWIYEEDGKLPIYYKRLAKVFAYKIRFTKVSDIPGYTAGAALRKKFQLEDAGKDAVR